MVYEWRACMFVSLPYDLNRMGIHFLESLWVVQISNSLGIFLTCKNYLKQLISHQDHYFKNRYVHLTAKLDGPIHTRHRSRPGLDYYIGIRDGMWEEGRCQN